MLAAILQQRLFVKVMSIEEVDVKSNVCTYIWKHIKDMDWIKQLNISSVNFILILPNYLLTLNWS